MLKSLLSNKEKLIELANTPLNENCSAVILKKLPEKLGDSGKFLIPCSFSELKCKALADLGIERDVFVPIRKFTFPADFVIVDYESDPQVPLILGRPFLRTTRALIDVHGEEMILRDGNERLILNIRNDTSSYSNEPHQESINMIGVYNVSHEEYHEDLFATNHPSGESDFHLSLLNYLTNITSPEVIKQLERQSHFRYRNRDQSSSLSPTLFSLEKKKRELNFGEISKLISARKRKSKILTTRLMLCRVTNCATPDKNVKKITNASLILEDSYPPLYELPFHKEVPRLGALLSFSSKNEEKVFNPGILTSRGVHISLLPELSHRGPKAFKVIKILENPMEIFLALMESTSVSWMFRVSISIPLDQLKISRIVEASRARGFVLRSQELHILSFILGIQYPNLID
ncbi:reverse transcriptase domain-containing protein [Tanacetum coccineum]